MEGGEYLTKGDDFFTPTTTNNEPDMNYSHQLSVAESTIVNCV